MAVKKDGYLFIEFMDGETKKIMFEGAHSWHIDPEGGAAVVIRYDDHHERYPLVNIRWYGPYYNSQEVVSALQEERLKDRDYVVAEVVTLHGKDDDH